MKQKIKYTCSKCNWTGSFDELYSEPYNDKYFGYCPMCKEPEPVETSDLKATSDKVKE